MLTANALQLATGGANPCPIGVGQAGKPFPVLKQCSLIKELHCSKTPLPR